MRRTIESYPLIAAASLFTGFWISYSAGSLYVQQGLMPEFIAVFGLPIVVAAVLSLMDAARAARTYLMILSSIFSLLFLIAFAHSGQYTVIGLYAIPVVLCIYYVIETDPAWAQRAGVFLSSFLILAYLTTILRIGSGSSPFPVTTISINNDEVPQGIPLLFQDSLVVITPTYIFTISVQFLFLLGAEAALLSENFMLIYRNLKLYAGEAGTSTATGVLVLVLGCQCETLIGSIPVLSAVVVSLILLPLSAAGIILLVFSNIFLRGFQRDGGARMMEFADSFRNRRTAVLSGLVMVLFLFVSTIGAFLSWELDIFYFYGLNFAIYVTTYLLIAGLFSERPGTHSRISLAASAVAASMGLMLIWLIPIVQVHAYSSPEVFGVMEISSFAGGFMLAFGASRAGGVYRNLILEMVAMMFTLIGAVILYYTDIFQSGIWMGFPFQDQLLFAVTLTIVSLPFLWFFNYVSIERKCSIDQHAV